MDTHAAAGSAGPLQVVVMGVAGTGKSTIGALLAADLGVELIEGDEHHPASNIEKLSSGQPLTDGDRWPWLETLAGMLAEERESGRSAVLTCSALRRAYRDLLRGKIPSDEVFFVHLHGSFEVLDQRMRGRRHFMPAALLQSQLDTLEPLEPDESGVLVDVGQPVEHVVEQVRAALAQWRAART